jgi:glycosyl-4,4'-diaponeurosporenoate acyltransferase
MLFWNVLIIALLHLVLLYLCTKLSKETMSYERPRFAAKSWEHNGKFYRDKLKINVWKDFVPQYVAKDGFSKESLEKCPSIEYIDQFLIETCRGEWYHTANLIAIPFLLLCNPLLFGIPFSIVLLVVHGSCTIIQRYNRFRLLILRKKLIRDAARSGRSAQEVITVTGEPVEQTVS